MKKYDDDGVGCDSCYYFEDCKVKNWMIDLHKDGSFLECNAYVNSREADDDIIKIIKLQFKIEE